MSTEEPREIIKHIISEINNWKIPRNISDPTQGYNQGESAFSHSVPRHTGINRYQKATQSHIRTEEIRNNVCYWLQKINVAIT